jgi:hypothetical protein
MSEMPFRQAGRLNLINNGGWRRIAGHTRNTLDVTLRVDGFAVLIGSQVGLQAYRLAAEYAACFREGAVIHKAHPYNGLISA